MTECTTDLFEVKSINNMEYWVKLALLIAVYGVLKELRFLDPFMTRFLMTPPMNFTHSQVFVKIYPASVYSQWVSLIVLFLVTDLLRYKPVILLNSLTGVVIYSLYSFSSSLNAMQAAYALTGLYYACELAYYTYIYAKVDRSHYQEVTGYTQAAYLIGRTFSGAIAQALVSLLDISLHTVSYITLGTMIFTTLWSFSLPAAKRSIYFNRAESFEDGNQESGILHRTENGFKIMFKDFTSAFKNRQVWKWIFWWMVADGIYLQVLQIIQLLWEEILSYDKTYHVLLNGAVDSVCTLSAAVGAYLIGKLQVDWSKHGDIAVSVFSAALGQIMIWLTFVPSLLMSYGLFILFFVFYNAAVIIARSQIALQIKPDSAGLTFGATMLLALLYQSLICGLMTQYLKLDIRRQFFIFGCMYFGVTAIYSAQWVFRMSLQQWKRKRPSNRQPSSAGEDNPVSVPIE